MYAKLFKRLLDFILSLMALVALFPLLLIWMWRKKRNDSAFIVLGMFIVVVLLNIRTVFGL